MWGETCVFKLSALPTDPTWLWPFKFWCQRNGPLCIGVSLQNSSSNCPALSAQTSLFNTQRKWGFLPSLFTSNSLDAHYEVCQTLIKSLSFAMILQMSIISQTSTCRSGFILIIHAHNWKRKKKEEEEDSPITPRFDWVMPNEGN